RLAPICAVRRSKSLPDSDATDQTANLNDLLSSRSGDAGEPEADSSGKSTTGEQRLKEELPTADNSLLGFVERLPRARRKSEPESWHLQQQSQHKALIKLTPFAEEQRRTKLHQASDSSGEQFVVEVQLEPPASPRRSLPTQLPISEARALPDVTQITPDPIRLKDPTSARRLSLREQESIERVTRYLDSQRQEHQPQGPGGQQMEAQAVAADDDEVKPLATAQPTQQQLLGIDPNARARRSSLKRSRHDEPLAFPSQQPREPQDTPQDDTNGGAAMSGEAAPKKTVRICSIEETIRIDSFDSGDVDEANLFPELQLVTAKILTAEEFADSMTRRDESLRSPSKEVAVLIDTPMESISGARDSRPEEPARLLAPLTLKPSASDNALLRSKGDVEKVSERNIRPEILMDLSRAAEESAIEERALEEQQLRVGSAAVGSKRRLSRVSSDSEACRRVQHPEEVLQSPPTATLDGGPFLFEIGPPQVGFSPPSRRETKIASCDSPEIELSFEMQRAQGADKLEKETAGDGTRGQPVVEAITARRWKSADDVRDAAASTKHFPAGLRRWRSEHDPAPVQPWPLEQRPRLRGSPKEEPPPAPELIPITARDEQDEDESEVQLGRREHSLVYQRQTLESPASLELLHLET
ncbi:hypothetical protein QAD02_005863, partial [Eretmocerus hayati]